jgi:hypothetical protein
MIRDNGTKVIRLPPNLNRYAERFVRSIKDECLYRLSFIGQASLRGAVAEYMDHYHRERNHQGIENRLIRAPAVVAANDAQSIATRGSVEHSTSTTAKRREQCRSSIWILRRRRSRRALAALFSG